MGGWRKARCAPFAPKSPIAGLKRESPWPTAWAAWRSASLQSWSRSRAPTGRRPSRPASGASTGSRNRSRSGRKSSPPAAPSGSKAPTRGRRDASLSVQSRQRDPVPERDDQPAEALLAGDQLVVAREVAGARRRRLQHLSAPERVVGDQEAASLKPIEAERERPLHGLLVRERVQQVVEDQVEPLPRAGQVVERVAFDELDAVAQARV